MGYWRRAWPCFITGNRFSFVLSSLIIIICIIDWLKSGREDLLRGSLRMGRASWGLGGSSEGLSKDL